MASCQEGQAYTKRGAASNVTANTNPSIKAYARISFSYRAKRLIVSRLP
jgi:hypothetical protein